MDTNAEFNPFRGGGPGIAPDHRLLHLDRGAQSVHHAASICLRDYKLGATSLLIRGYDPRPDAIQYGEELIPRIRELVADYDAASRPASVKTLQTG